MTNSSSNNRDSKQTMGEQAIRDGDTRQFGDLHVSTRHRSADITIELILYLVLSLAIFITAAVIDEAENNQGFGASEAWLYVTLLTVGFLISRGLAKIAGRDSHVL